MQNTLYQTSKHGITSNHFVHAKIQIPLLYSAEKQHTIPQAQPRKCPKLEPNKHHTLQNSAHCVAYVFSSCLSVRIKSRRACHDGTQDMPPTKNGTQTTVPFTFTPIQPKGRGTYGGTGKRM